VESASSPTRARGTSPALRARQPPIITIIRRQEELIMTKRTFKSLGAASLLALFTAAASPAQAGQITAEVPFSFTVNGGTSLPPGTYTLDTDGKSTVLVRGASRAAFSITNRLEDRGQDECKLVFHKYGDTYILRQVWMGNGVGRELPQSRLERDLRERKLAENKSNVTVAAK
jgi:hypothetical protein